MKTILITGASGLIGSEMVREFISRGNKVIGLDLVANKELEHPDYQFIKTDLTQEKAIKAAFKKIRSLDVLINNGARANPAVKPFEKISLKEWNEGMASNLTNYFLMSREAIPLLLKSQGNIIHISSTRHKMSEPHTEIYSATKGAIDALTRAMAITYAHKIRVNSISPGWIADPNQKFRKVDHEQHPVGRVGRPADIAKMAMFLASDDASFITGQDFIVDGGMTVKMIYEE